MASGNSSGPSYRDAASVVIGVPDLKWTETVNAIVTARAGATVDDRAVIASA
jgi:hypothetical protein